MDAHMGMEIQLDPNFPEVYDYMAPRSVVIEFGGAE